MVRAFFFTKFAGALHPLGVTVRADLGQRTAEQHGPARQGCQVTPEFEAIYEQHFDLVWRTLRRLGVPNSALDDALQDVFLVVYRRLEQFEQRSSLQTWIFGITLRVASDYCRRGRRQERSTTIDAELHDQLGLDPHEHYARSEAVELLYKTLAELDPEKRAVFVLAELEEMTMTEVASAVGENVNTVSSRVKAARRQFEAALRRLRAKDDWRSQP